MSTEVSAVSVDVSVLAGDDVRSHRAAPCTGPSPDGQGSRAANAKALMALELPAAHRAHGRSGWKARQDRPARAGAGSANELMAKVMPPRARPFLSLVPARHGSLSWDQSPDTAGLSALHDLGAESNGWVCSPHANSRGSMLVELLGHDRRQVHHPPATHGPWPRW